MQNYEKQSIRGEVLIGKNVTIDPKTGINTLRETIFRRDLEPNEFFLRDSILEEKTFNVSCSEDRE